MIHVGWFEEWIFFSGNFSRLIRAGNRQVSGVGLCVDEEVDWGGDEQAGVVCVERGISVEIVFERRRGRPSLFKIHFLKKPTKMSRSRTVTASS